MSWYRVIGKDFNTNTGIKVEQSDTDFLVGRAGLAVGKTIPLGQDANGQSVTFTLRKLFKSPLKFCAQRTFVYYTSKISVQTIVQGTFEELP